MPKQWSHQGRVEGQQDHAWWTLHRPGRHCTQVLCSSFVTAQKWKLKNVPFQTWQQIYKPLITQSSCWRRRRVPRFAWNLYLLCSGNNQTHFNFGSNKPFIRFGEQYWLLPPELVNMIVERQMELQPMDSMATRTGRAPRQSSRLLWQSPHWPGAHCQG